MKKTILITGATDGIGLETAKMLVAKGHNVLIHGRNGLKLEEVTDELSGMEGGGRVESYLADLSDLSQVEEFAEAVIEKHEKLDALINNAGVFVTFQKKNDEGLDTRFVVNTIAPYLLTKKLLPLMDSSGRVVNLSSAAQATVDLAALSGRTWIMSDDQAYAQTKLALTMWSYQMAEKLGSDGPAIIAVNPKSMLGSKMVKEAYGVVGSDLSVGADILCRASLSDEFADASGKYFDNDFGQFRNPHPDAMSIEKCDQIVGTIEVLLAKRVQEKV